MTDAQRAELGRMADAMRILHPALLAFSLGQVEQSCKIRTALCPEVGILFRRLDDLLPMHWQIVTKGNAKHSTLILKDRIKP